MMLQSHNGVIKLFPSMDYYRSARFARLRAQGAFLVSAAMDRGFVLWAQIEAQVGGTCRVRLPWPPQRARLRCLDTGAQVALTIQDHDLLFDTQADKVYRLEPEHQ